MKDKLKLQVNLPVSVELVWGNCFHVMNRYGNHEFLYTVNDQGVEKDWYANAKEHEAIVQAGGGKGAIITITKTPVPGSKAYQFPTTLVRPAQYPGIRVKPGRGQTFPPNAMVDVDRVAGSSPTYAETFSASEMPSGAPAAANPAPPSPNQPHFASSSPQAAAPAAPAPSTPTPANGNPRNPGGVQPEWIAATMAWSMLQSRLIWWSEIEAASKRGQKLPVDAAAMQATAATIMIQCERYGLWQTKAISPSYEDMIAVNKATYKIDEACSTAEQYLESLKKILESEGYTESIRRELTWHCLWQAAVYVQPGETAKDTIAVIRSALDPIKEWFTADRQQSLEQLLARREAMPW